MSANTIPDDVMRAALLVAIGTECMPSDGNVRIIASAILAERQRCAAIVRSKPVSETADRFLLERAILNPPSAASSRAETGEAEPPLASSPVTNLDWITWNGGECPVDPEVLVEYRLRGHDDDEFLSLAENLRWGDRRCDIIAYRVAANLTHEEAQ